MSCKKFQTDVKKAFDVLEGKKNISAENRKSIIDKLKSIDGIKCDKKLSKQIYSIFDKHFGPKQNYTESRALELYADLAKQLETKLDCADESDSDSGSDSESDCDLKNERLTELRDQLRKSQLRESIPPLRNTEQDMWLCPDCKCEVCECIKTTLAERMSRRSQSPCPDRMSRRSQSPFINRMSQQTPRAQSPCPERLSQRAQSPCPERLSQRAQSPGPEHTHQRTPRAQSPYLSRRSQSPGSELISRRSPSPKSYRCPKCQAIEAECRCLETALKDRMSQRSQQAKSPMLARLSQRVQSSNDTLCPICKVAECICEEQALLARLSRRTLSPSDRRSIRICPKCKYADCECPIHSQRATSQCALFREQMELSAPQKIRETTSQKQASENPTTVAIEKELRDAIDQTSKSSIVEKLQNAMKVAEIDVAVISPDLKLESVKLIEKELINTTVIPRIFKLNILSSNNEVKEHVAKINKIIENEWTKLSKEQRINFINLE